ncbi:MAG: UDP-N-acetylglucosamine 1-carboxyvinyltransferase [Alphaproteobacteria bacterium]|nr:UDP-N-acetylglucosamine 1-carboxyvinyltransferase [Alphaproteobacteria bacterium]
MDKIRIVGGRPLIGTIPISGAKNAALPLMAACLLTDDTLTLSNMPYLADIVTMANLLAQHGVQLSMSSGPGGEGARGRRLAMNASAVNNLTAPYDLVRTMRASVLVLGPLLARHGAARVSLPGGCAIGTRPIDLHLKALEQMGAKIELVDGYINARTDRLHGADITFEKVSVGATENLLMAAALAEGKTTLRNAAREPEVVDLAHCLQAMGANIEGIGTDEIVIHGVARLHGCQHAVVPDRIEAGTYAACAAITGGDVELLGVSAQLMQSVIDKFAEAGVSITETPRGLRVTRGGDRIQGMDVMTQPFPGFPTDMQAQMMALLSVADGASMVTETIFENRYMHVPELMRMGAKIVVHGSSAMIRGTPALRGAEVMATDLRASVSLVIAALAAEGETIIHRVYHLDRGYEGLEEKLSRCGAIVERIGSQQPALRFEAA